LNATAAGVYSGTLSFANNDGDENPFEFTISGTVAASVAQVQTVSVGASGAAAPLSGQSTKSTTSEPAKSSAAADRVDLATVTASEHRRRSAYDAFHS
jgi:hypothetical protein